MAVAVLVVVLAAGYVVGFTGLFAVHSVAVSGLHRMSRAQVLAAARVPWGRPLVRVDTKPIGARVAALPGVSTVQVSRSWPRGVQITVTERTAAAYLRDPAGTFLVDAAGVAFERVPGPPAGMTQIALAAGERAGSDAEKAALAVIRGLPAWLRAQTLAVSAKTPDSVTLSLHGGRSVLWGSSADADRKATVLKALLDQPGTSYDVSSPAEVAVGH